MELRPIQAALLAGRSASRRATTAPSPLSYPSMPSFYRCFSSTRSSLSEAEATAPAPPPSMQEWHQQQQLNQQSEQPQPRTWGNPSSTNGPNTSFGMMSSLLKPKNSTPFPSPSSTASTSDTDDEMFRIPWSVPSTTGLRRSQASRPATDGSKPSIIETLSEMGLAGSPTSADLTNWQGLSQESASEIKYRLRPSVGRTVHLDSRVDLARGLSLLNTRVRVNKISQDVAKQRFHERPGLKRKRLRSERWRARFKDGFKATCSRVQDLARQGW